MKKLILTGMALAGMLCVAPEPAMAHGGQYRGPGDVVPPNPGGGGGGRSPGPSGPTTPGPSGPSAPGPTGPSSPGGGGPSTGGPTGPGGGTTPTTGAGGVQLGDDLTAWAFWWEFNKDPFINLREAIHDAGTETFSEEFFGGQGQTVRTKDTLRPTKEQIQAVLPQLKRVLESTNDWNIVGAVLVAMGKIGEDHPEVKILDTMRSKLPDGNQEISETAALSMGISQRVEGIEDLTHLALADAEGRKLVGNQDVNSRTQTFAAYALALIAFATEDTDIKRKAFEPLKAILEDDSIADRNIRVAALTAMGLLRPNPSDEKGRSLLMDCLDALEAYDQKDLGTGEQIIQAHCATSVAKLCEPLDRTNEEDMKLIDRFREPWLLELQGRSRRKRASDFISQSIVVALGRMTEPADPKDRESLDARCTEALIDYSRDGKDQQTRYFAYMGLGMIGGEVARTELLRVMQKGLKSLERPWAAISLGVMAFNEREAGQSKSIVWESIGSEMLDQLKELKDPQAQSAMAVGLGLMQHLDAADYMRDLLVKEWTKDPINGYLCIGLALMGDANAVKPIRDVVNKAVRRPDLLRQAAISLGKLGDKAVAEQLRELLTDGNTQLAKMSAVSSALGFIGDRNTIDPLMKLLFDENLTPLSRAFAAVAIGEVCNKELLPWNSKVAINMNYRASVETLTNQATGILDIL